MLVFMMDYSVSSLELIVYYNYSGHHWFHSCPETTLKVIITELETLKVIVSI